VTRPSFYPLQQGLLNIKRNITVHVLGFGTIAASLLILGAFLLLFENLNNWLQSWGNTLSMSVYLKDGISSYQRHKIHLFITDLPGSQRIWYISKEDAMEELKGALGDEASFLNELSHNPLPASYEILFDHQDPERIDSEVVKRQIEALDGVEEVQHSRQWVEKIGGILDIVRIIGYVIGGLLCLCVVFIVTNTIKLTIYLRRDEIEILKLVGATDWFIKLPFLWEGMVEGLLGGVTAIITLYLGYLVFSTKELYLIGPTPLTFCFLPAEYTALILLLSILLGISGSFVAIGRFFHVP